MYDKYLDKTVFVNVDQGNIKGTLSKCTKKYLVLLVFETSTEELFKYIIDRKKVNYIAASVKESNQPKNSSPDKRKEKSD